MTRLSIIPADAHHHWPAGVDGNGEVDDGGSASLAQYEYNGLNWRIIKRADTDIDDDLDEQRLMYYSATPGTW